MSISLSAVAGARAGDGAAPPAHPPFTLHQRRDGAVDVLAVAREPDLFNAPRLRQAIACAGRDVVLELTQVGFVDSSVLASDPRRRPAPAVACRWSPGPATCAPSWSEPA